MNDNENVWRDVIAFADPFTDYKIKRVSGKSRLEIVRNGRQVVLDLHLGSGVVTSRNRNFSFQSIDSLLCSEEFANISGFVETQKRLIARNQQSVPIPARVRVNGQLLSTEHLAETIRTDEVRTSLLLIDGPAGVGKTFQVQEFAKRRALRYGMAGGTPPVLHIGSQGRRLSNLRDVLAATTQDLGAAFGARHVPLLVRRGLIIAAIDGFDELVDADGYEDAWSALRSFIEDVGSGGLIILAARDTFVEEQELLERIGRADHSVALTMAHVQTVRPDDALEWLRKVCGWKDIDLNDPHVQDIFYEGSYALRPFFLRALGSAGGWSAFNEAGPRTFLTERLISREAKLIAQQLGGITGDDVIPKLQSLFQEVALEMVSREVDSVEVDHLAFLVRYCFEEFLEESGVRKLAHKAGSFALLEISMSGMRRKFAHEEMRSYFLAEALLRSLCDRVLPVIMRRTAWGAEHFEVFAEVFVNNETRAQKAIEFLFPAVSGDVTADSLAQNGGAMLLLALSLGFVDRLDFLTVYDAVFAAGAPIGEVVDSDISRLDVTSSNIAGVKFSNVNVGTLVVSSDTVFGESVPRIEALEIRSSGGSIVEREPGAIERFISEHGVQLRFGSATSNSALLLLEKIARRAVRYFYLRQHGDDDGGSLLLRDTNWPKVESVLRKYNRIETKNRKAMHGRPSPLIRIVNPRSLLDFDDPDTKIIISEL